MVAPVKKDAAALAALVDAVTEEMLQAEKNGLERRNGIEGRIAARDCAVRRFDVFLREQCS